MRGPGYGNRPHRARRRTGAALGAGAIAAGLTLALAVPAPGVAAGRAAAAPAPGPAATRPAVLPFAPVVATVVVRVSPPVGSRTQSFAISLRRPTATGGTGLFRRHDSLTVAGPRRRGCVSAAEVGLPDGPAGRTTAATLDPRHLGGRWCVGTFRGIVVQTETVHCAAGPIPRACPFLVVAPQTIGRFHFRVR